MGFTSDDCTVEGTAASQRIMMKCKVENWRRQTCLDTTREYAENTSLHGIAYVMDRSLHTWERSLWMLVSVTSMILALVWIVLLYRGWDDDPVVTNIKTTGAHGVIMVFRQESFDIFVFQELLSAQFPFLPSQSAQLDIQHTSLAMLWLTPSTRCTSTRTPNQNRSKTLRMRRRKCSLA